MRLLITLAALLLATPALAAPTARVSGGDINVRSGPGTRYQIIGQLPEGAQVNLDYCTRNNRWCLVADTGWVDASYLVGWSAKMRATPPDFQGPFW
jgi:uncharacterized protein YraI